VIFLDKMGEKIDDFAELYKKGKNKAKMNK